VVERYGGTFLPVSSISRRVEHAARGLRLGFIGINVSVVYSVCTFAASAVISNPTLNPRLDMVHLAIYRKSCSRDTATPAPYLLFFFLLLMRLCCYSLADCVGTAI